MSQNNPRFSPTWTVGRVVRANAGALYNAVRTDNGKECPLEPSHSEAAMRRRVNMLNSRAARGPVPK